MTRIEHKLNQFMEEVRNGKRESSVASNSAEVLDEKVEDETGWSQLQRELEDAGISPAMLSQHKDFVITWFRQKLADDTDEDTLITTASADSDQSTQTADTETHDLYSVDTAAEALSPEDFTPKYVSPKGEEQPAALRAPHPRLLKSIPRKGPLLDASRIGDIESVEFLLQCKVDINYSGEDRMCALNIAAMYGQTDIVQILIEQPGVKINGKNWLGHTPLSLAAWYGHENVVQVLLTKSETKIDPTDWEVGQTPLSLATEQGNTTIARLLLAHGADPNARDNNGRTALGWAAEKGRPEETNLLLADDKILPNLADNRGITPLHQAVKSRNDHVVRVLLARKDVDLNSRDSAGRTAFDLVVQSGSYDLVHYFEIQFTVRGHMR